MRVVALLPLVYFHLPAPRLAQHAGYSYRLLRYPGEPPPREPHGVQPAAFLFSTVHLTLHWHYCFCQVYFPSLEKSNHHITSQVNFFFFILHFFFSNTQRIVYHCIKKKSLKILFFISRKRAVYLTCR